ncbi:hypothetical protein Hanom_Chr14g01334351 [Helianthus anomalus]
MSASHSVCIAANHRHLFEIMLIKESRSVWDLLRNTIATRDMFYFPLSQHEANFNCVSILDSDVSLQVTFYLVLTIIYNDIINCL